MNEKQILKAVPIYDEIKATQVECDRLAGIISLHRDSPIKKIRLINLQGVCLDVENLDVEYFSELLHSILLYKTKKMESLHAELEKI